MTNQGGQQQQQQQGGQQRQAKGGKGKGGKGQEHGNNHAVATSAASNTQNNAGQKQKEQPPPALTPEQIEVQTVPKDAAMLELIPRGDVFAAHKLATHSSSSTPLPADIGEKLSLFQQSFTLLRFPHKMYQPVVSEQPTFDQTFNVDSVHVPPSGSKDSSSSSNEPGSAGGSASLPKSMLSRGHRSFDLHSGGGGGAGGTMSSEDVKEKPTKTRTTVNELFEGLEQDDATAKDKEKDKSKGDKDSKDEKTSESDASSSQEDGSKDASPSTKKIAAGGDLKSGTSSSVPAASSIEEPSAPPSVSSIESLASSAKVLRSYFPQFDWQLGAEAALCERVQLPVPSNRSAYSVGSDAVRFLFHAKNLTMAINSIYPSGNKALEPLFCELALYNTTPADARSKLSDTFSVQLNNQKVVQMLLDGRAFKMSKESTNGWLGKVTNGAGVGMLTKDSEGKDVHPDGSPFVPQDYLHASSHSPCTRALFTLPASFVASPSARQGVVLVLLVYKILQGKLDPVLDTYAKGSDLKDKDLKSAENAAHNACRRWGETRQLVMWSAQPVFNEAGGLAMTINPSSSSGSGSGSTSSPTSAGGSGSVSGPFRPSGSSSGGSLSMEGSLEFKELYRPPKVEEAFTLQSLCDAAAAVVAASKPGGKKHGFKVLPGTFSASITLLPSARGAALAECEKIAPVYNRNLVPARMEEVVESAETVCVGHQVVAAEKGKLLKDGEANAAAAAAAAEASGAVQPTHSSECSAAVQADEWVEVDEKGMLVRHKRDEGSKDSSSSSSSLIALHHSRPRSYLPPPDASELAKDSTSPGFICEIDPLTDLAVVHHSVTGVGPYGVSSTLSGRDANKELSVSKSITPSTGSSNGASGSASTAQMDNGALCPFHLSYTNHLYIYPQSISFADARNVCIGVQLKDTHEEAMEVGLDAIYPRADELLTGPSSVVAPPSFAGVNSSGVLRPGSFVNHTLTPVTYHAYNASFVDELKIELPLVLKPTHHLLFTFFNISCKDGVVQSKDGAGNDKTLLGYAMLPLYLDNRIVDEKYTLPVRQKLRTHYLLSKDEWEERRSSIFNVKLRLHSSVYTNDPYLNRFFLKCTLPYVGMSARDLVAAASTSASDSAAAASTSSSSADDHGIDDNTLALMLRKVLRSGVLKKKGAMKWSERWVTLQGDGSFVVHKSHRESKVLHHTAVTPRTATWRSSGAGSQHNKGSSSSDDELKYAWTIRSDGTDGATANSPTSPTPSPTEASTSSTTSPNVDASAASSPAPAATPSPDSPAPTPSPSPTAASTAATDASSSEKSEKDSANAPPPAAAAASASTADFGAATSPSALVAPGTPTGAQPTPSPVSPSPIPLPLPSGLDVELLESEMMVVSDSEEDMFSWLKSIAHAKIAKASLSESIRQVKEAQPETLIQHLPALMRMMMGVMCAREESVDQNALAEAEGLSSGSTNPTGSPASSPTSPSSPTSGNGSVLDRVKSACFETLLEVSNAIEAATSASGIGGTIAPAGVTMGAAGGERMRNVYLDTYAQYVFDDNSTALPMPSWPTAKSGDGGDDSKNGENDKSSSSSSSSSSKYVPRLRAYESIATLWLNLLNEGGYKPTIGSSPSHAREPTNGSGILGASSTRSVAPLREHAAKYSWFLLDLMTKSLLLSTAGARERRVSMSGKDAHGGTGAPASSSPFSPYVRRGSISNSKSSAPAFFKPPTLKLLTSLVIRLTHEVFTLSSISLSLSKHLNKNLALFLRDAFYIFPRQQVFDWISLYMQISYKMETVGLGSSTSSHSLSPGGSSSSSGGSGASASGSSSRLKFTFLQIICDHEHYVAYNNRKEPFMGEAKRYLQSIEFGEWNMGDYLAKDSDDDDPERSSLSQVSATHRSRASALGSVDFGYGYGMGGEGEELDSLHPMRVFAAQQQAMDAECNNTSVDGGAANNANKENTDKQSARPSGIRASLLAQMGPSSGHFLPFVLIKQVWLAFRPPAISQSAASGPLALQQAMLQDQALQQSAYTLRTVLTKHEYDSKYQSPAKKQQVAAMYLRLLPCLWLNLDKLRSMRVDKSSRKTTKNNTQDGKDAQTGGAGGGEHRRKVTLMAPGSTISFTTSTTPHVPNGLPSSSGSTSSPARKDLVACALYVLHNIPPQALLQYLQGSEYRIPPKVVTGWAFKFLDLLQLLMETTEYAGPLMRRMEAIQNAGGVVANLTTILCSRMLTSAGSSGAFGTMGTMSSHSHGGRDHHHDHGGSSGGGSSSGVSDWGGAEEIGSSRLGGAGALSALESKYTRTRQTTQIMGHRKSITSGGGTIKRRDMQLHSNLHSSAERARTRLAHRTLTHKTVQMMAGEGGSDAQFHAMTGIDPSIARWEKLYAHESSAIVLHTLTHLFLPMSEGGMQVDEKLQDRLIWFLHGCLRLNQSDQLLERLMSLLSALLAQYSQQLWPLRSRALDIVRCGPWWFELLRLLSFHAPSTRTAAARFIFDIFLSVAHATGSTSRLVGPLYRSFARLMDYLRNKRSEDGTGTYVKGEKGPNKDGWTVLQAAAEDNTNDAVYVDVLTALRKSCVALQARARDDPRHKQLPASITSVVALGEVEEAFRTLQQILDTSAIIHSVKAPTLDPDTLIEHCYRMVSLYRRAPRSQLFYYKSMFDLHLSEGNLAEAASAQWRMANLLEETAAELDREAAAQLAAQDRGLIVAPPKPRQPLWNATHLLSCMNKASELFEASELLEQAIAAELRACAHFLARRDAAGIIPHQRRLLTLWEKLATLGTVGDTRSFGTYYRVGFWGKPFKELDGKEFIYRERNLTKLPEITSRLVNLYSKILGCEVSVFKDSSAIDRAAMEPDQAKLQVTAVLPYFPMDAAEAMAAGVSDEELALSTGTNAPPSSLRLPGTDGASGFGLPTIPLLLSLVDPSIVRGRSTHFEKHTALRHFFYDTPFTTTGKSHGSVAEQYKRRTHITVDAEHTFPSCLKRLPVASRKELVLSPLECVLEDIHKRVAKLLSEARPPLGQPDLKTLTQVLSGSVNVQVNGGTAEVCAVFLDPESKEKWNEEHLAQLRLALAAFVKACGEALKVAVKLANEANDSQAFIEVLQQGYEALVQAVKKAAPDLL